MNRDSSDRIHHLADGQFLPSILRLFAQFFERKDPVQSSVARYGKMGVAVISENSINKFRHQEFRRHAYRGRSHDRADRAADIPPLAIITLGQLGLLAGELLFAVAVIGFGRRFQEYAENQQPDRDYKILPQSSAQRRKPDQQQPVSDEQVGQARRRVSWSCAWPRGCHYACARGSRAELFRRPAANPAAG